MRGKGRKQREGWERRGKRKGRGSFLFTEEKRRKGKKTLDQIYSLNNFWRQKGGWGGKKRLLGHGKEKEKKNGPPIVLGDGKKEKKGGLLYLKERGGKRSSPFICAAAK